MKKLEDSGGSEDPKAAPTSGIRVFGMAKAQIFDASNKVKLDNFYNNSDSEDDLGTSKRGSIENGGSELLQKDVNSDLLLVQEDVDTHKESVFKVMKFLFSVTYSEVYVLLYGYDTFYAFLFPRTLMRL